MPVRDVYDETWVNAGKRRGEERGSYDVWMSLRLWTNDRWQKRQQILRVVHMKNFLKKKIFFVQSRRTDFFSSRRVERRSGGKKKKKKKSAYPGGRRKREAHGSTEKHKLHIGWVWIAYHRARRHFQPRPWAFANAFLVSAWVLTRRGFGIGAILLVPSLPTWGPVSPPKPSAGRFWPCVENGLAAPNPIGAENGLPAGDDNCPNPPSAGEGRV